MARKLSKEATIVLCNGPINLNYAVTSISAETTDEEVLKQSLRSKSPPDVTIHVRGSAPLSFGTSLVSVGNMVYCIGGSNSDKSSGFLASKEVRRFDPNKPELELDCNHPPMNQGRFFPAVVALQMIIYVFGGLSQTDSNNSPYAECLDTKKPKHRQKWKPLTEPPNRLSLDFPPFAIPYEANTVLIGSSDICMGTTILIGSRHVAQGALLYGVHNGVWNEYLFNPVSMSTIQVLNPVSVVWEKTIYWVDERYIYAYDLDKHILYVGYTNESVLYDFGRGFDTTRMGPVLMHLQENIFCCFTVYVEDPLGPSRTGVVECTKFRVTKYNQQSADAGVLHLQAMGYQSYRCENMCELSSVLRIHARQDSQ
ncbi:hypothetical protein AgCh_004284 [Apium graveolens]